MNSKNIKLKDCPFCGLQFGNDKEDLMDILYPVGSWKWKTTHGMRIRSYGKSNAPERDGFVWGIHCTENMGGCGVEITGDTKEEVIKKWNSRI